MGVNFQVSVILPGDELVLAGTARDLSAGGMRVVVPTDLPSGQPVVLRFTLPNDAREFIVRGRVILSFYDAALQQYAHGIAFTQYGSQDRQAIESFVSGTLSGASYDPEPKKP